MKLTFDQVERINFETTIRKERIDELETNLLALQHDDDRDARLRANECPYCYYIYSRIAGQAFTDWSCGICGKQDTHCNTATPRYCSNCADEHRLCVACGGTVTGKQKRWSK